MLYIKNYLLPPLSVTKLPPLSCFYPCCSHPPCTSLLLLWMENRLWMSRFPVSLLQEVPPKLVAASPSFKLSSHSIVCQSCCRSLSLSSCNSLSALPLALLSLTSFFTSSLLFLQYCNQSWHGILQDLICARLRILRASSTGPGT